ncbi:LOW QUALITY PROTEIN: X-box-binding protein 1 [Rhinophrynus dorsalis]
MVVMGAPKVIFIPGNQSEQTECKSGALGSVMLPIHSPASPESTNGDQPPRKRQRLTHLSPEEKALRRKLKNRVAAQTARDRKKARMSELEQQVIDLEVENEKLLIENKILREKSHGLVIENQELRQRLGLSALEVKEEEEFESLSFLQVLIPSRKDEVRPETGSAERSTQTTCTSAAGAGPDVSESDNVYMDPDSPDSSDSESDILLGLLESLDSDLLLACEGTMPWSPEEEVKGDNSNSISPSPSSPVGTPSAKLEAINELIRFDHVYTKPISSEQGSELGIETNVVVVKMEEASFFPACDVLACNPTCDVVASNPTCDVVASNPICDVLSSNPACDVLGSNPACDVLSSNPTCDVLSSNPTCDVLTNSPACVKDESQDDDFTPDLGMQSLLSCPENNLVKTSNMLDTGSDSGYEGGSSPFSELSSPLNSDQVWEDSFTTELFPQLLSVHMHQPDSLSSPVDTTLFWNQSHSPEFDVHF